jgi:sugar phosphate permease
MARFGARLPLSIGPVVIAVGFLVLMRAGHPISYWADILPGVIVLGIGMSIFVTPLTATVMNAVPERLAGVASGISNTLTRIASLLAVAVLGLVVANRFDHTLSQRLAANTITSSARASLLAHSDRLADDPIPSGLTRAQRTLVHGAITDAYVDGYRWDMAICAFLCLASAAVAFALVRDNEVPETRPH